MKKPLIFLTVLAVLLCFLVACTGRSIYAMERDSEKEAREEIYREGVSAAQNQIDSLVESDLWDLEYGIEDKYGMSPEEAIQILTNYADGEPVSKAKVSKAIWAIRQYYYGTYDIVNGIDDYWVD